MADIIQFVPRPNPNRQRELERQAIEIANEAFPQVFVPYNGEGIDGMNLGDGKDASYALLLTLAEAARLPTPSRFGLSIPYTAPEKDPA